MGERLVITTEDLPPAPKPEFDPVYKLFRGEPWQQDSAGNSFYVVPDMPHVHRAIIQAPDASGQVTRSPEPATVLVAHGFRDQTGRWTFKDGRPVTDFIDSYNLANPAAPIDVAAVCNPTTEQHPATQHAINTTVGVSGFKDGDTTIVNIALHDPNAGSMYIPPRQAISS